MLGTENVLTAAIEAGVKSIICLSTDKAAYPVNAMGITKALEERVAVAKSRTVSPEKTKICCTRYGNVMCSRGSVIPLWIDQIRAGKPITITDPMQIKQRAKSLLPQLLRKKTRLKATGNRKMLWLCSSTV